MMRMDERIRVLILRTLGLDQDEVVGALHCAKASVVEVEKWFRDIPRDEAIALLDDNRIKRVIDHDLERLELQPTEFIKAGRITADDILMRYGRVRPGLAAAKAAVVVPAYARMFEDHWAKLREMTTALRAQLSPLSARILFSAEVCHMVHAAAESGAPLLHRDRWRRMFDAPIEIRPASNAGAMEVRLLIEDEFLYPHLVTHLEAEFPGFAEFDVWRTHLTKLLSACLDQARDVTLGCSAAAGLSYIGADMPDWITYQFPAYVCQVLMENPGCKDVPELLKEVQPDGSWRLLPRDFPAITIAGGKAEYEERCRQALQTEIWRNADLEVWQLMSSELAAIHSTASQLQLLLTTVAERGDFEGTCSLCEQYFERLARY
jgi:hypothetical protein